MKFLILLAVLSLNTISAKADDAPAVDCANAISQADMNYCAGLAAQASADKLSQKIYTLCARSPDVRENQGGSIYSMELNYCVEAQYKRISKGYKALIKK